MAKTENYYLFVNYIYGCSGRPFSNLWHHIPLHWSGRPPLPIIIGSTPGMMMGLWAVPPLDKMLWKSCRFEFDKKHFLDFGTLVPPFTLHNGNYWPRAAILQTEENGLATRITPHPPSTKNFFYLVLFLPFKRGWRETTKSVLLKHLLEMIISELLPDGVAISFWRESLLSSGSERVPPRDGCYARAVEKTSNSLREPWFDKARCWELGAGECSSRKERWTHHLPVPRLDQHLD